MDRFHSHLVQPLHPLKMLLLSPTRAVAAFGLTEMNVHDMFNVFQVIWEDKQGRCFTNPCPAMEGGYIEFLAEQDLLMDLRSSMSF